MLLSENVYYVAIAFKMTEWRTSSQDGGIGRYTVPACTTTRRTTTKNNQKCQKIQQYGSPTTKELKKKHSSRPGRRGRDLQPGQRGLTARHWLEDPCRQVMAGGAGSPTLWADKPQETTGEWDRPSNPGFQCREIKSQNLWLKKTCGGWGRRNSQPHRRVHWRDQQGPRTYTNPPTWESAPEVPSLIVGRGGSDWNPAESGAGTIALSQPLPHIQYHSPATSFTLPWVNT